MNAGIFRARLLLGLFCRSLILTGFLAISPLWAQANSPEQNLAAMEACRERVISGLSLGDKMKMKSALGAIRNNPEFLAANRAVTDAKTPEAQIAARKSLANLKLDLIARQDPSLKPVVENIRAAQAAALR